MKLFISYARLNMTTAEALVRDLHALGHQAFYDQDLTGGQRWWDTLLDQIQAADVFVPVLSDEYRESQACRVEAEWADSLHVSFLPVFTDEQLPGMYDPIIAEANWVGYDPVDRGALAELARGVSSVTKRTPPEPLPARPAIPLSYLVVVEREIRGDAELGRHRQLAIVSDLRSKLGTRESSGARELLQALRERPDVTFEVATTVDALLATPEPVEPETTSAASTEPSNLTTRPSAPVTAGPQKGAKVRRTAPTTPTPAVAPASDAAPTGAAIASSRLARFLGVVGALAMFLAVCMVPWVTTADSDSRTWYSFFQVVTLSGPRRRRRRRMGDRTRGLRCDCRGHPGLVRHADQGRGVRDAGLRRGRLRADRGAGLRRRPLVHRRRRSPAHLGRAVAVRARRGAGESRAAQALDRQGPSPEQVTGPERARAGATSVALRARVVGERVVGGPRRT